MSFATAGTAHDGQKWRTCGAISKLAEQIEARRVSPWEPADGTVASRAHDIANPTSDHTVWPLTAPSGVVYAIDIGEPAGTTFIDDILEAIRLSQDRRLKYAIHNGRLFSSYPTSSSPAWTWRPYSGYNGHFTHGHISVHHELGDDAAPWTLSTIGGNQMAQGQPSQWAAADWQKANEAGVLTQNSHPHDLVNKEQLVVLLSRMGVIETDPTTGLGRVDPDLLGALDHVFGGTQ